MSARIKVKKIQSRTWGLILPCEWDNCMNIVYKAKALAKHYYWVRHDRDFYGDAPEDSENSHEPGELKKPHVHLLFTFNSSRDLSTVQNYFSEFPELKDNSFEKIANAHGAKRYLVHADNPEKAQYQPCEVETNDKRFSDVFIEKVASADELAILIDAYNPCPDDFLSWKDYISKFHSTLVNCNSYQKSSLLDHHRREWRFLLSQREFNRNKESKQEKSDLPF